MNLLIKLIGERRLSKIYQRYAAKQVKERLKAEFQDDEGRWYYSFRDDNDVPIERAAMTQTNRQYISAGLSGETIKQALSNINELYAKGEYVKAGVIIHDLQEMQAGILNFDALIGILAANYVREDEDLSIISNSIHQEKCNFLKSETSEGRFFFRLPLFIKLLNGQTFTKEELATFYQNSMDESQRYLKRWRTLQSLNSEKI